MARSPDVMPSAYRIEQAMSELGQMLAALYDQADDVTDDRDIGDLLDNAPGGSDGMEVLRGVMRYSINMEDCADALARRIAELNTRRTKFLELAAQSRTIAFNALQTLGLRKLPNFPEATVYVRDGAPSVVITDENLVPDRFKVEIPATKRVDKALLLRELKTRAEIGNESGIEQVIEGASLSNGAPTLVVRR